MSPPAVSDRQLRRVLHTKDEKVDAEALAADRRHINQALEATLREALPCVTSTQGAPIDVIVVADPSLSLMGRPPRGPALGLLQSSHAADAYLRLRVTDYGETPRRWRGAYIGFEVVTTIAIAAGLYVHKVTRPVAGAYLLEEGVEEFSEGYAGFWTLNRLSRPVRIEADMIDGQSGQGLWHGAHTGLARWRWRSLRHVDPATRDALLTASMNQAVRAFFCLHAAARRVSPLAYSPRLSRTVSSCLMQPFLQVDACAARQHMTPTKRARRNSLNREMRYRQRLSHDVTPHVRTPDEVQSSAGARYAGVT